ncbi:MAG: PA14 domain-containing protein [Bacteroidota bacterium]
MYPRLDKSIGRLLCAFWICSLCAILGVNAQDSDGDLVPDITDIDDDNDGILDIQEIFGCTGRLNYEFYDLAPPGRTVDNIPTTGALSAGVFNSFDVDDLQNAVDPGDTNQFSIRYTGNIIISTADTYTFYTVSDDGSKVFIDGIEVVDNDGNHGPRERSGTIFLTQGVHTIEVLFYEDGGGEILTVSYSSATITKQALPFSILFPTALCDQDGDGVTNELDLDTDGDGIPDNVEAQDTFTYIAPSGFDIDGNGLDDAYEAFPGSGDGLTLTNTNISSGFDFGVLDADDDGILDTNEAGITLTGLDSDGDGLDDAVDTTDAPFFGGLPNYNDPNGNINVPSNLPNQQNTATPEVDFRDPTNDTDADGVLDEVDVDDDNDGILDSIENNCNGEISYEFYDLFPTGNTVDNIPVTGALATGVFPSFNVDALQNLVDPGDRDRFSIRYSGLIYINLADTYTFFTTSDDGSKLFIDGTEVVDNDGLHGAIERSGTISLGQGYHDIVVLFMERTGGESLAVRYQSTTIAKTTLPFSILYPQGCDTDNDGIPNARDTDSDNDGCVDTIEAYNSLAVDPDFDGIYGSGVPTVNLDGSVVGAPYTTPEDLDTNGEPDFLQVSGALPSITTQPSNITICTGCTGSFTVSATADNYTWQYFDGTNWIDLTNDTVYSGVNTTTLTLVDPPKSFHTQQYRVVLTNSGILCPIISDAATLFLRANTIIVNRNITYRVRRN